MAKRGRVPPAGGRPAPAGPPEPSRAPGQLVGIGASAGGLEALTELLRGLGAPPDTAVIVVQHRGPDHEELLAELLAARTPLRVAPALDGAAVEAGALYVAPPRAEVTLDGQTLRVATRKRARSLPIDVLLTSLADRGSRAVGVVLAGTGTDGGAGVRALRAAGASTFAQDPATTRFADMPRFAIATGCVDQVLAPFELGEALASRAAARGGPLARSDAALERILALVSRGAGLDLGGYKRGTIARRVERRMELDGVRDLAAYAARLEERPDEVAALGRELLINVSSFFREPAAFELLAAKLLPGLLAARAPGAPLRVWVPACSTGEEVYSLAMVLFEEFERRGEQPALQLFGTDLSDAVIQVARAGVYPERTLADVSAERRRRFFTPAEGGGRISRQVRDACVFARHDLLRDPPFSRMNLVSCRNLFIYLEPPLQRRALQVLHYALVPGGLLALSASESASALGEFFSPVAPRQRIYARSDVACPRLDPPTLGAPRVEARLAPPGGGASVSLAAAQEADRLAVARHAPPAVLVDERLQIVQFRGATTPYLEHRPGEASLDLLKMARHDLAIELRATIARARRERGPVRRTVSLVRDGVERPVDLDVVPLLASAEGAPGFLLVSFAEGPPPPPKPRRGAGAPVKAGPPRADRAEEVEALRTHLRAVLEEHEATTARLSSTMEEASSSNEELQSINEELETAKEELQSTNEELTTVNEELRARNAELLALNADVGNLLTSIDLPVLMLDRDLGIRRFTAAAQVLLNVRPSDIGRPLGELRATLGLADLEARLRRVVATGAPQEESVQTADGRRFSLWLRPYLGSNGEVDGAVLALFDVTSRDRARASLADALDRLELALAASSTGTWTRDLATDELTLDDRARRLLGRPADEAAGTYAEHLGRIHPADREAVRAAAAACAAGGGPLHVQYRLAGAEERWLVDEGRLLGPSPQGAGARLVGVTRDVTAQRAAEEERRRMAAEVQEAQRLEGLALLAGGVAHDFNNLLVGVQGNAELAQQTLPDDAPQQRYLARVVTAAQRASDLAGQLLAYAGRGRQRVERVSLSAVAAETAGLLEPVVARRVRLELTDGPTDVVADASQLQQVVMNLLVNAAEAMEGAPGTISLRTRVERAGPERFADADPGRQLGAGEYVVLEVEDAGGGMTDEVRRRIFEPFYSTKFVGRGLGLAATHGILRAHGGAILVRSAPGRGSTFTLFFPAPPAEFRAPAPAAPPARGGGAGRLRVLVVDDDPTVREVIEAILTSGGLDVVMTGDGASALAALEAPRDAPIEVALVDLTMSSMSGEALLAVLRATHPALPVVLMSGYSDDGTVARLLASGAAGFVRKPFEGDALLSQLRAVARPG